MSDWKFPNYVRDGSFYGKSFEIEGPLNLEIDFDDVNHPEVIILADSVAKCLNDHFVPPVVWTCPDRYGEFSDEYNEDCDSTVLTVPGTCLGCSRDLISHEAGQA